MPLAPSPLLDFPMDDPARSSGGTRLAGCRTHRKPRKAGLRFSAPGNRVPGEDNGSPQKIQISPPLRPGPCSMGLPRGCETAGGCGGLKGVPHREVHLPTPRPCNTSPFGQRVFAGVEMIVKNVEVWAPWMIQLGPEPSDKHH